MNNTKTKTKSYLFAAIGFLLTLALDQWTKYLASTITPSRVFLFDFRSF